MSLPTRQLGGYKATVNNPNVTEEAKDDAREAINELEQAPETQETRQSYDEYKGETRTNAGYKATMKNPNVSEEAKERARDFFENKNAL